MGVGLNHLEDDLGVDSRIRRVSNSPRTLQRGRGMLDDRPGRSSLRRVGCGGIVAEERQWLRFVVSHPCRKERVKDGAPKLIGESRVGHPAN